MGSRNFPQIVSTENDKGRLRLRWRFNAKRYSLNLSVAYNKINLVAVKETVLCITNDIMQGSLETSLEKYRTHFMSEAGLNNDTPAPSGSNAWRSPALNKEHHKKQKSQGIHSQTSTERVGDFAEKMIKLFEEWAGIYKNRSCEKDVDYRLTKNMMKRWGPFTPDEVVLRLQNELIADVTYNRRLYVLKEYFKWLTKKKHIPENPLEDVDRKKIRKKEIITRRPFTSEETIRILEAIRTDRFVKKSSRYKHSTYYPFLYFLFSTGVRNAEAVGLRVKDVDFSAGKIKIENALARTLTGTHPKARVMKETKNGKIRFLPINADLTAILKPLVTNKNASDLIFTSVNGLCIDDRMFLKRVFKPVLKALEIGYRTLYACRHGFASRLIDSGINPVTTAFLLGNNPETALRNYTHLISLPESLPNIVIKKND